MPYDPQGVKSYFDSYGTREWERLELTLQGRIKYRIHRHFLDNYVPDGARVLDVGCGPGRFALDLARGGACLTLADLSPTQLDLARQNMAAAGLLEKVQAFHCLDVVDMHELGDASFDVAVCYGAAISYTRECHKAALRELWRVLRPGGRLLISVCSLYGTLRLIGPFDEIAFLEQPDSHLEWQALLSGEGVVCTRPGSDEFHQPMVLFNSAGLRQALAQAGFQVVEMAAANPLVPEGAKVPKIEGSEQSEAALAALEVALCNYPGLVDTGEHLLAVADKPYIFEEQI